MRSTCPALKLGLARALVIVFLISGLTACGPSETSPPPEIRIGVLAPFSGDLADTIGKPTLNGALLMAQQVNAAGGLAVGGRKHPVTLIPADDQDNPQAAVNAAQKLINQNGVVAFIGIPFSRIAIPVAELLENQHIPMITSTATNPAVTAGKRYVFRTIFIDPFQGTVLARFAFEELGVRKAAVLYDIASAYNQGLAEFFKQQFEAAGGRVVAFERYTTGAQDFSVQLRQIKNSGAEVLLLPNYSNEVPAQARQARQMGLKIPFLGGDTWGSIRADAYPALEGGFFSVSYALELNTAQNRTFLAAYRQVYNADPDYNAAQTYDACGLLFQAIRSQGKADAEAIHAGLESVAEYTGVTGTMRFQGSGDPIKSAVMMQVKNGKVIFHKQVNP